MHTKTLPKNLSCRFGEWVVEERPYPGKHALRDSQVIILSIYFLFSSTLLKQQKPPYVIKCKCLTLDHCQESWHYNRKSSHWVVVIKVNYPPQKKNQSLVWMKHTLYCAVIKTSTSMNLDSTKTDVEEKQTKSFKILHLHCLKMV